MNELQKNDVELKNVLSLMISSFEVAELGSLNLINYLSYPNSSGSKYLFDIFFFIIKSRSKIKHPNFISKANPELLNQFKTPTTDDAIDVGSSKKGFFIHEFICRSNVNKSLYQTIFVLYGLRYLIVSVKKMSKG